MASEKRKSMKKVIYMALRTFRARNPESLASLAAYDKDADGIICLGVAGEVPERPIGAVSKTVVALVTTVGSNPTLSA